MLSFYSVVANGGLMKNFPFVFSIYLFLSHHLIRHLLMVNIFIASIDAQIFPLGIAIKVIFTTLSCDFYGR